MFYSSRLLCGKIDKKKEGNGRSRKKEALVIYLYSICRSTSSTGTARINHPFLMKVIVFVENGENFFRRFFLSLLQFVFFFPTWRFLRKFQSREDDGERKGEMYRIPLSFFRSFSLFCQSSTFVQTFFSFLSFTLDMSLLVLRHGRASFFEKERSI